VRSGNALFRSMGLALLVSTATALLFGVGIEPTEEILSRTAPSLLSALVAVISGFAVAYAVARPNLSATLPGVAVAVSLIPPLGVVGIGISLLSWSIISGALVLFLVNVGGIFLSALLTFSLMDVHPLRKDAVAAAKNEDALVQKEIAKESKEAIAV